MSSIIDKATRKFLGKDNKTGLAIDHSISEILANLASDIRQDPRKIADPSSNFHEPDTKWEPKSGGYFTRHGKSQFVALEGDHTFLWKEDVSFEKTFEMTSWDDQKQDVLLIINFEIDWKSNVSETGRFTQVTYIDAKITDSKLEHLE
ncbi:hypothetical protein [Microbulbifer sp. JMSA002]|uniref:hypothetical protein n=1 Tax=Microbulbifer sp. JMSA002 TaxID=3243368 RepID=UPI00403A2F30